MRQVPSRPCPTNERADRRRDDDGPVFTSYGIGSAALGVVAVAAIVLATLIWAQHRSDADELHYRTRAMQAAADWTSVLINMNKDTVEADLKSCTRAPSVSSMPTSIRPSSRTGKLVQKLQAKTTGQIDSVAVESIHHAQPGPNGAPRPNSSPSCRRSRRAPTP